MSLADVHEDPQMHTKLRCFVALAALQESTLNMTVAAPYNA